MDRCAITFVTDWAALKRFAASLRDELDASRVLLFGSRARGDERGDSDYDVIVVSPRFADVPRRQRAHGLRALWLRAGGHGPMDMICLTPAEFEAARHGITLIQAVFPEAIDLLATRARANTQVS
jgi:hypothetical protein